DPNGLVMGIGEMFILGQMLGSGVFATSMWVQCGYSELNHQIRYIYFNDYSNSGTSSFYDLPDAPCTITVVWVASSGPGADDGFIELYIDGDHKETITGIDNDGYDVDAINVGAVAGMDAGTSGALYFDEIKWSDDLVRFPAPLNAALTILVPTVALRSARRLYARRRDTNLLVEA
ncbi:MAG: hypothetical protein OEZ02_14385, partial [Anaerolineae bacterium]|nr:hypothetical protein [Anaerolineae bacterium]